MTKDTEKDTLSLSDDAIKSRRGVSRRALLLGAVGGTAMVAGAGAALAATDSDGGGNADPAGRGRTGMTDNDDGSYDNPAPSAIEQPAVRLPGGPPPDRLSTGTSPLRGSFARSYPDPGIVELDAKPLVQTNR